MIYDLWIMILVEKERVKMIRELKLDIANIKKADMIELGKLKSFDVC